MSFLGKIFGSAVGETVKGIGEGVSSLANGIRSAITGDLPPEKRAELEKMAMEAEVLYQKSQTEINKIEAQHASIFIAGWRPFIGWICGLALGFNFIINPLIVWISKFFEKELEPPMLDIGELYPLVLALLGLGVYRTYEKGHNVQNMH